MGGPDGKIFSLRVLWRTNRAQAGQCAMTDSHDQFGDKIILNFHMRGRTPFPAPLAQMRTALVRDLLNGFAKKRLAGTRHMIITC